MPATACGSVIFLQLVCACMCLGSQSLRALRSWSCRSTPRWRDRWAHPTPQSWSSSQRSLWRSGGRSPPMRSSRSSAWVDRRRSAELKYSIVAILKMSVLVYLEFLCGWKQWYCALSLAAWGLFVDKWASNVPNCVCALVHLVVCDWGRTTVIHLEINSGWELWLGLPSRRNSIINFSKKNVKLHITSNIFLLSNGKNLLNPLPPSPPGLPHYLGR